MPLFRWWATVTMPKCHQRTFGVKAGYCWPIERRRRMVYLSQQYKPEQTDSRKHTTGFTAISRHQTCIFGTPLSINLHTWTLRKRPNIKILWQAREWIRNSFSKPQMRWLIDLCRNRTELSPRGTTESAEVNEWDWTLLKQAWNPTKYRPLKISKKLP